MKAFSRLYIYILSSLRLSPFVKGGIIPLKISNKKERKKSWIKERKEKPS